jgi:transcriptional regulator with XRE-family HTH domain
MDDLDALIGKNLARLRGDLSQADLAKAMKEHGFKWSQATVWAIEKGDRPLRLAEAQHLAEILKLRRIEGASVFLQSEATASLREAIDPVIKAHSAMEDAIKAYLEAQDHLAETADILSEKLSGEPGESILWMAVHSWLTEHSATASAAHVEKAHQTEWLGDLPDEMADFGVRTVQELARARDAAAQEQGFKDYETLYAQNMRTVGNYSGMQSSMPKGDPDGEHSEEA